MYRQAQKSTMLLSSSNALALGKKAIQSKLFKYDALNCTKSAVAQAQLQLRWVNTCLLIKGLPFAVPKEYLYTFFKTNYGEIKEIAFYDEVNRNQLNEEHNNNNSTNDSKKRQRSNMNIKTNIGHNRPPGQTAIINFESTNSAIMCKEELHWRPFPLIGIDDGGNYIYRPFLEKESIERNPRDRPLVNIIFETSQMREKLRPWVRRDLKSTDLLVNLKIAERRKDLKKKMPPTNVNDGDCGDGDSGDGNGNGAGGQDL